MYSLILHGRRSLELHKWHHLKVSVQNAFTFSSSFSSASAKDGRKAQIFTFSYLVDSLGLTPKLAESISLKVSFEEKRNPDSVLNLFRSYGFKDSQISSIITDYPRLLVLDVEKSIGPKLEYLQSRGASTSELTEILSKVPKILGMKGKKMVSVYYDFVKADKSSKFEKLCRSLPQGMQERKIRNVSVLRELGVPQKLLLKGLISDRRLVCRHEVFKESVEEVVEMGVDPMTSKFVEAIGAVQGLSDEGTKEKGFIYRGLGFDVEEVWEMFKKCPNSLRVSKYKITQTIECLKICGLLEEEILSVFKKFPQCIGYPVGKLVNFYVTFLDLGFSKDEIVTMVKRFPQCLDISLETVKKKTKILVKKKNKFVVKKMKWSREAVVSYPEVLGYNMEKRIVPRCNVVKALMSKGLLGDRKSKLPDKESVLVCSDEEFLKKYVRNHDDKKVVAELMAIYRFNTNDFAS